MANDRQNSLAYERPAAGVPRWQFRLLFLLVLVNLVITIQTAYAPQVASQVKQRWAAWRAAQQTKATNQRAFAFVEPPTKVVWDDNPGTAAKLLASPGYRAMRVDALQNYPPLARWPRSAAAAVPPAVDTFHRLHFRNSFPNLAGQHVVEPDSVAAVMLHRMKTPGGEDRVVFVYVTGGSSLYSLQLIGPDGKYTSPSFGVPTDRPWEGVVTRHLRLRAVPCRVDADGTGVSTSSGDGAELLIHPAAGAAAVRRIQWSPPAGDRPEQVRLSGPGEFRFYAGQPDPSDPTHFTVGYDVDGAPGTIHGRLAPDGTIKLEPTTGRVVGSQWNFQDPGPTTKP
jgi:hypothetical protein